MSNKVKIGYPVATAPKPATLPTSRLPVPVSNIKPRQKIITTPDPEPEILEPIIKPRSNVITLPDSVRGSSIKHPKTLTLPDSVREPTASNIDISGSKAEPKFSEVNETDTNVRNNSKQKDSNTNVITPDNKDGLYDSDGRELPLRYNLYTIRVPKEYDKFLVEFTPQEYKEIMEKLKSLGADQELIDKMKVTKATKRNYIFSFVSDF